MKAFTNMLIGLFLTIYPLIINIIFIINENHFYYFLMLLSYLLGFIFVFNKYDVTFQMTTAEDHNWYTMLLIPTIMSSHNAFAFIWLYWGIGIHINKPLNNKPL